MRETAHVRSLWRLLALSATGIALAGCGLLDLLPTLPPDKAPTGVTASYGQENDVHVTWGPVERATTYRVFRADDQNGTYVLLGEAPSPPYSDPVGVANRGRLYWYKVEGCNSAGCGPKSVATAGYAGYPPAPTNVRASGGTYPDRIVITWDPVPGATYYQVFRDRFPDGTFGTYLGESATATMDDTTVSVGTGYWYKVRACTPTACGNLSTAAYGYR